MKKQIIVSGIIAFAISTGSLIGITVKNTRAESSTTKTTTSQVAFDDSLGLKQTAPKLTSTNETIYAISDTNGKVNKSFVNNIVNTSTEALPISLTISYYLDDESISADKLASKSGHVRIVYNYAPVKTYQNKYVPFIAITGLTVDNEHFSNLSIKNGKIISEGEKTIIAGYSLVGVNENFGTDFLPNNFEIEADVTDFKLETTYTLATNEPFTDIDTTKLTSIDGIINSVNQLASGLNQIINGAKALESGLGELSSGLSTLKTKVTTITTKIIEVTSEAEQAINNLDNLINTTLDEYSDVIPPSIDTITEEINAISDRFELDAEARTAIIDAITSHYEPYYNTINTHKEEIVTKLTNGTATAKNFVSRIKNQTVELQNGVIALSEGANQLYTGSTQLKNGLIAFKSQGIDKLINFANSNLSAFTNNLRKTIEAANSYRSYNNSGAKSVKFVFKTPAI